MTSVIALFLAVLGLTSTAVLGLLYRDVAESLDDCRRRTHQQERDHEMLARQVGRELIGVDGRLGDLKVSHQSAVEWLEELQHSVQLILVAARRFGLALMPYEETCEKAPVVR